MFFTKAKRAQNVNDYESWIAGGVAPTLNAMDNNGEAYATVLITNERGGGNVPMVFPIQDGREIEKNQNGLGIGEQDAPAYTLDRTGGQSVAIPIQGTVIGRADTSGPQGKGFSEDGSPMFTLDRVSGHGVATESVVRRLTPVECERLQGFPDNWTDGQADSNRYKQMGNAVAVPVVEWIIDRMVAND